MNLKKLISLPLSLLLAAQPLFSAVPSSQSARLNPYDELFFKCGKVADAAYYNNDSLVIWIQDLHMQPYVQKNIVKLVKEISSKNKSSKIYAEGVVKGKIDVSVLDLIPGENRKRTIEALYDSGFLSAAEYMSLEEKTDVFGVEDKDVYLRNLTLLENILRGRENEAFMISEIKQSADKLLLTYLSKEAAELYSAVLRNREKAFGLNGESFIEYYPNLERYVKYARSSDNYSAADIEKELRLYIGDLKNDLLFNEYSSLMKDLNSGENAAWLALRDFMTRGGSAAASKYRKLKMFLDNKYAALRINNVELVAEEDLFERQLMLLKSVNKTDSELLDLKKAVDLLEGYLNASVSGADYENLKANRSYYETLFGKYLSGQQRISAVSMLNDDRRSLFYENNLLRDKIFAEELAGRVCEKNVSEVPGVGAERILSRLGTFNSVKVIIAGGFHYGITEELRKNNVSYMVITPEVKSLITKNNYDDFILYGAEAFNKIFHADFDFGSPEKAVNGFLSVISKWGMLYDSPQRLQEDIESWIASCDKISGIKADVSGIDKGFKIKVDYKGYSAEKDFLYEEGAKKPSALGKNIEALVSEIFAGSDLPGLLLNHLTILAFRGVNDEYLTEFKYDTPKKQLLRWVRNFAQKKFGKNAFVKVSANQSLISSEEEWALATLSHENGNFVLYLNEVLFEDYLFKNLPGEYSSKRFISRLAAHEKKEFEALNIPSSDLYIKFHDYLKKTENSADSAGFHKFLESIGEDLGVFEIASKTVRSVLKERSKDYLKMYDAMDVNDTKKALLALNLTVPKVKDKEAAKLLSMPRSKRMNVLFTAENLTPVKNEAGILLTSKAAAYYRTVSALIHFLKDKINVEETIDVMGDSYESAWVKLAVLRHFTNGRKIIATNIRSPGRLIWSDSVFENEKGERVFLHTNNIFFHEASEESKVEEGLRRFGSGSVNKALEHLANAQEEYLKQHGAESPEIKKAAEILSNPEVSTAVKKSMSAKQLAEYVKKLSIDDVNGIASFLAAASYELRRDYFEYMIEYLNSDAARSVFGKLDKYIFVIDARGVPGIKQHLKKRIDALKSEYGEKYEFFFADEIVDKPSVGQMNEELNEWSQEYAKSYDSGGIEGEVNNPGRILYGTVYSRYVGLLLELVTLANLTQEHGYRILQSGREIKDENGKYVTELDVVAEDKDGKISIIECKSARTRMQYKDILKSKIIYKLDTYAKYAGLINKDINKGKGFDEVVFVMDLGSNKNISIAARLKGEEEKLSGIYGFPVKFIFMESNPDSVKKFLDKHQPKPLSLINPVLKSRPQKLIASMFAPIAEVILWAPLIFSFTAGFAVAPAAFAATVVLFSLFHNFFEWLALNNEGKKYGIEPFAGDFFKYLRGSFGLGAATSAAYGAAMLFTANPLLASFAAFSANIIVHYIYQIYAMSGTALKRDDSYFRELRAENAADAHKRNMVEALKEAELAREEEKELATFLKPPVGAFITDDKSNEGRGFNRKGSLLHAEYFAMADFLQRYINVYGGDQKEALSELLNAALLNAQSLNKRIFEKNPAILAAIGYQNEEYPKKRDIDAVFAETNKVYAFINSRLGNPLADVTLYCTLAPCNKCARMMATLGIKELVFASPSINHSHNGKNALADAGIKMTGEVLADKAAQYIENYRVANKSRWRTNIASAVQTFSRFMASLTDIPSKAKLNFGSLNELTRSPVNAAKTAYESAVKKPREAVVRIAETPETLVLSVRRHGEYDSKNIAPVVFTRYGFMTDDERSSAVLFSPLFTARSGTAKVSFEVYSYGSLFYVKLSGTENIDEGGAYALAYVQLLKEIKEGVLNPSANENVGYLLGGSNIDIIAVETGPATAGAKILAENIDDLFEVNPDGWGEAENIENYRLARQMRKEIEDLRLKYLETETVETRHLFTESSVSVNIASLSKGAGLGKISDIQRFAEAVKGGFRSLNISGYLPFDGYKWIDELYIDWVREAERAGLTYVKEAVERFERENESVWKDGLDREKIGAIKKFEDAIARELAGHHFKKPSSQLSDLEMTSFYKTVVDAQLKDLIANVHMHGSAVNAHYVYDNKLTLGQNADKVKEIISVFDGVIVTIDAGVLPEFTEAIYRYSRGKAVAYRVNGSSKEEKAEIDRRIKNDYSFRVVRDFEGNDGNYGRVVELPLEKATDANLEKLGNASAVIVSVPESSNNVVEKLIETKNGEKIISKLMKAAKNIKSKTVEKSMQDHYLLGVNIIDKASPAEQLKLRKNFFKGNVTVNGVTGRGIIGVLKALDADEISAGQAAAIFETFKKITANADENTFKKISLITGKIGKLYEAAETDEDKNESLEMFKNFVYGIYYQSEIAALPALQKYEGAYVLRAGNYAADVRKNIIETESGLKIEGNLRESLDTLYFMLSADMIMKNELLMMLDNYCADTGKADIKDISMLAVIVGSAAKKYDRREFLKYSGQLRERVLSYKAQDEDKWIHVAAAAALNYVENDNVFRHIIKNGLSGKTLFENYKKDEMIMAVTLFELLEYDRNMIVFDVKQGDAADKIINDYELAGLYAKLFKLTSSASVNAVAGKLQEVMETLSVTPVNTYAKAKTGAQAASLAMALTEICELNGLKNDFKDVENTFKQSSALAVKSILSAA